MDDMLKIRNGALSLSEEDVKELVEKETPGRSVRDYKDYSKRTNLTSTNSFEINLVTDDALNYLADKVIRDILDELPDHLKNYDNVHFILEHTMRYMGRIKMVL